MKLITTIEIDNIDSSMDDALEEFNAHITRALSKSFLVEDITVTSKLVEL